jgi:hypothetical protein
MAGSIPNGTLVVKERKKVFVGLVVFQSNFVSLRADVLERLKAPIEQSQGESGSNLQA